MVMKKKYISPNSIICYIEPVTIMAGSDFSSTKVGDQTVTPDPDADIPGDEFTSRRRDIWEDEEDYY